MATNQVVSAGVKAEEAKDFYILVLQLTNVDQVRAE